MADDRVYIITSFLLLSIVHVRVPLLTAARHYACLPSLTISMISSGWNVNSSTSEASYGYSVLHLGKLGTGLGGKRGLDGAGGFLLDFFLDVSLWTLKQKYEQVEVLPSSKHYMHNAVITLRMKTQWGMQHRWIKDNMIRTNDLPLQQRFKSLHVKFYTLNSLV